MSKETKVHFHHNISVCPHWVILLLSLPYYSHSYIYIFFFTHTNNSKCLPYIHETLYFMHFKDFTYLLPIANSEFTDNLICMYFDCGRKSKYPGEKMQTPHRKAIARVQTVQLLKAQNLHNTHFCNRWTQYNSILHLYDQNYMYLSK